MLSAQAPQQPRKLRRTVILPRVMRTMARRCTRGAVGVVCISGSESRADDVSRCIHTPSASSDKPHTYSRGLITLQTSYNVAVDGTLTYVFQHVNTIRNKSNIDIYPYQHRQFTVGLITLALLRFVLLTRCFMKARLLDILSSSDAFTKACAIEVALHIFNCTISVDKIQFYFSL